LHDALPISSSIAANSATLNGVVNPNGLEVTECKLEYGTTTRYGSTATCTPPPGSGTGNVAVSAAISGLSENTTYHFRIVAKNAGGTSEGADETFKTTSTTLNAADDKDPPTAAGGRGNAVNRPEDRSGRDWTVCKCECVRV